MLKLTQSEIDKIEKLGLNVDSDEEFNYLAKKIMMVLYTNCYGKTDSNDNIRTPGRINDDGAETEISESPIGSQD